MCTAGMDYEDSLIVKTAWYYYIENMTQQKISEKLGISRMKVIKLLEKARQTGVIQFKISPERSQQLMLEQKLTTQWNLKDVFVVPTPPNGSNLNETIAQAAAMADGEHVHQYGIRGYPQQGAEPSGHHCRIPDLRGVPHRRGQLLPAQHPFQHLQCQALPLPGPTSCVL